MIIIFEGPDRCGKTTLAKKVAEHFSIPYFKSSKQGFCEVDLEQGNKHDWRFMLDFLSQTNPNVVFDRSFISQYVYSRIFREENVLKNFESLDKYWDLIRSYYYSLINMPHLIVYCRRKYTPDISDDTIKFDKERFENLSGCFDSFVANYNDNCVRVYDFENGIEHNFNSIISTLNNLLISDESAFRDVRKGLEKARAKHPLWPKDPIHAGAVVAEEAGELVQATLEYVYEDGEREAMRKEAVHTAVTSIRFLELMDSYDQVSKDNQQ